MGLQEITRFPLERIDWITSRRFWRGVNKKRVLKNVDESNIRPALREFLHHYHALRDEYVDQTATQTITDWDGATDRYSIRYLLLRFKHNLDDHVSPSRYLLADDKDLMEPLLPKLVALNKSVSKRRRVAVFFTVGYSSSLAALWILYVAILPLVVVGVVETGHLLDQDALADLKTYLDTVYLPPIVLVCITAVVVLAGISYFFRHLVELELGGE